MISNSFAKRRVCAAVCVLLILPFVGAGSEPAFGQPSTENGLASRLNPLISAHNGTVAVAVRNLKTGEEFSFRADIPMPTASLIKFPLMVAAFQRMADGELDANSLVTVSEQDKVPGSGILTEHFSSGTRLSLGDLIHLMIVYSDNTATNLVAGEVGLEYLAKYMERLGFAETRMHSLSYRRDTSIFPERSERFGLGSTTAAEIIRLLEMVWNRQVVSEQACNEMLDHLFANNDDQMLKRNLPVGTRFAHKTGAVTAVRNDAGIIDSPAGPIAVCVLTSENTDKRYTRDNEGEVLCAEIGQAVFRYFNPDATGQPLVQEPLRVGSSGELVESLQRTLNARLNPASPLAVDGEFGPATLAALNAFQSANSIPVSEMTDAETWKALGPLVASKGPVAAPEIVNASIPARSPPESLGGPPVVTARGWAIGDAKTGEVLWHHQGNVPMPPASVTKIMTAWVVVNLAEKSPEILKETITISPRAAATEGSTCGLLAGESTSVGELLYGMMLPSGNDASVAMAEHFGKRLADENADASADPYGLFVGAMNREAVRLGLEQTSFRNTNGLTAEGHQSSAADLVRLGALAMQRPLFREIAGTAKRGGRGVGPGGYSRNIVWETTNQLLQMEGYSGIKTGTTRAAGACLAACGSRGDRELIVVVLGCDSSQSRYADARNLFRWAWENLSDTEIPDQAAGKE